MRSVQRALVRLLLAVCAAAFFLPVLLIVCGQCAASLVISFALWQGALPLREAEKATGEEGWAETVDVGELFQTERQRVRLFGAAVVCLFSLSLWRRERAQRTQSARALQACVYSTPASSLLGGACAFLGGNWRFWLAILCAVLALAICAWRLYLPPDALPAPVYSLSAWRELLKAHLQARLTRGAFPAPAVQQARAYLMGIGLAGGMALLSACWLCFALPDR